MRHVLLFFSIKRDKFSAMRLRRITIDLHSNHDLKRSDLKRKKRRVVLSLLFFFCSFIDSLHRLIGRCQSTGVETEIH